MSEITNALSTELCKRVGLEYPPPYEVAPTDYEWTQAEEDDFVQWMKQFLLTVPMFKRMGKRHINKEISWFIFQYGWKIKEESNGQEISKGEN